MARSRLAGFVRQNAIGLLALFVALGGTGYAATKLNGKNIKTHSIAGNRLKNNTLTGTQINESKLGQVPSAHSADTAGTANAANTANTASALAGLPTSSILTSGCGPGKVNGYAHIDGFAPSFPSTSYTSSAPFIDTTFNCSGQAVQVKRSGTGNYQVRFPGNPGTMAFVNVRECSAGVCVLTTYPNAFISRITGGTDTGAFEVLVYDAGTTTARDAQFDVLVP
jgi:hypothetical protein